MDAGVVRLNRLLDLSSGRRLGAMVLDVANISNEVDWLASEEYVQVTFGSF